MTGDPLNPGATRPAPPQTDAQQRFTQRCLNPSPSTSPRRHPAPSAGICLRPPLGLRQNRSAAPAILI
eukprot:10594103-Lingulodinium_polyedra.AAC.1